MNEDLRQAQNRAARIPGTVAGEQQIKADKIDAAIRKRNDEAMFGHAHMSGGGS